MSREQKLIFAKEKLKEFQNKKNTTKLSPNQTDSTKESTVTGIRNLLNTLKSQPRESTKDTEDPGKANYDYLLSLTDEYTSKNDELYRQLNDAHLKIGELDEINCRLQTELESGQGTNAAHNAAQEYIRTIGDLVAERTELTSKLSLMENRLGVIDSQLKSANIKTRTAEQNIVSVHNDNNRLTSENELIKTTQRGYQQQLHDKDAELTRLWYEAQQSETILKKYKSENENKSLQLIQYASDLKSLDNLKLARQNEVQAADEFKYQLDDLTKINLGYQNTITELETLLTRERTRNQKSDMLTDRYDKLIQKVNILARETCGTDVLATNSDIDTFCQVFTGKVEELVAVAQNMEKLAESYKSENSKLRQMVEFYKENHFKLTEQCREAVSASEDYKLDCDLIRYQKSEECVKLVDQLNELTQTVKELTLDLESKCNLVDSLQVLINQNEMSFMESGDTNATQSYQRTCQHTNCVDDCDKTRLLEIVDELETQNRAISRYVVLYRQQRHVLNDKIGAKDRVIELYQERLSKVRFLTENLLNRAGNEVNLETADSILKLAGESSVQVSVEGMGTDEVVEQIAETLNMCDLSVVGHLPIHKLCRDCKGPIYIT